LCKRTFISYNIYFLGLETGKTASIKDAGKSDCYSNAIKKAKIFRKSVDKRKPVYYNTGA